MIRMMIRIVARIVFYPKIYSFQKAHKNSFITFDSVYCVMWWAETPDLNARRSNRI